MQEPTRPGSWEGRSEWNCTSGQVKNLSVGEVTVALHQGPSPLMNFVALTVVQVTGIRQDAYANAHRIEVEEDKPRQEQGHYLQPELFGASPERAVGYQAPSRPTHAEAAREATSAASSTSMK